MRLFEKKELKNLDKENIRKIRGIILFTGVVVLALIKFDLLWETLVFIWEILQPFVVGGMMAFVANLPMTFFEKKVPLDPSKKLFPGVVFGRGDSRDWKF